MAVPSRSELLPGGATAFHAEAGAITSSAPAPPSRLQSAGHRPSRTANGRTDASSQTVASGVLNLLTTVDAAAVRSPLLGAFVHPVVFDEKVNEHAQIRGHDDKDDP